MIWDSLRNMALLVCLSAMLLLFLRGVCGAESSVSSFSDGWGFRRATTADVPSLKDDGGLWRPVDLPHDYMIENATDVGEKATFEVVSGKWRFQKGDNPGWAAANLDERDWQDVSLPATWETHSNYSGENLYGWFRRRISIPKDLEGQDVLLCLGQVDDVDETYFNGTRIGSTGSFPPDFQSAWSTFRRYIVPARLIRYGEENQIAVRVFDGQGEGGIKTSDHDYGPFDANSPAGHKGGYLNGGVGWYRKRFSVPDDGRRTFILFDGVQANGHVWINGADLGERAYGYSSFYYDVTPHLSKKDENIVTLRTDVRQPCSRWYTGAGLYRHVRLIRKAQVHIPIWGTYISTPAVSAEKSMVRIRTMVRNQSETPTTGRLRARILEADGKVVAEGDSTFTIAQDGECELELGLTVPQPRLWDTESPSLYRVEQRVLVGENEVDRETTSFGIRTFEFTMEQGFFLNGKKTPIKGVCLHHDQGPLGARAFRRAMERQLEILKEMGCNAIRCSHNPPDPAFLDLCDRMGFLVVDEAFDEWRMSKTQFGYGEHFVKWAETDVATMVRRDRNHPSVILWSIGNEVVEQRHSMGGFFAKKLADICRREDPTRPIMTACNDPLAAERNGLAKALDVLGINYSTDADADLRGKCKILASETASTLSTRGEYNLVERNGQVGVVPLLNNQITAYDTYKEGWAVHVERQMKVLDASPWVAGEFVWSGFDYIGEPTPFQWPSCSSYFGILDLCGFPKDRYYLYKARWRSEPLVHILPHWNWPQFSGKEIPVWCYTNCDSVELFLEDQSLGELALKETDKLHLEWRVPYKPGTLKAVGKKAGKVVCTDQMATAGAPAKLSLTVDRPVLNADGQDLAYITIRVLDAQGRLCPDAESGISFEVTGAGQLIGTGNGNPVDHEGYQSHKRKAFHGLCLVIVKAERKAGEIEVSASARGLESHKVTVKVQLPPK